MRGALNIADLGFLNFQLTKREPEAPDLPQRGAVLCEYSLKVPVYRAGLAADGRDNALPAPTFRQDPHHPALRPRQTRGHRHLRWSEDSIPRSLALIYENPKTVLD